MNPRRFLIRCGILLLALSGLPLAQAQGFCSTPIIVQQPPSSQTAVEGETVIIRVRYADPAPDLPPLTSCQWYFVSSTSERTNIAPGAGVVLTSNTCTLIITNASPLFAGYYYAYACNECCGGNTAPYSFLSQVTVLPFKIDSVALEGSARDLLVLQFTAVSNRTYTVQNRVPIDSTWSDRMSVAAQPSNRVVSVTNNIPAGSGSGFYRLVATRQP
jgi:hypothetical protein